MTPKKTLKKWFSNFMKPAQEHFAAWIDSYWHKDEQIPMKNIDGLSRAIENTVSAKQLLNHLDDTNAHRALFDELKRQIQAIQTILQVDDVNLDTLQEIVTELKANTKLQELIDKKVNKEDGKGLSTNDFTNEHKQKLEGLQPTDVSGLLPKGGYDGTGQELKDAIDGLQTKMQQVETTLSVDDTAFDTLQEIATQVKSNKNLEQLLTGMVNKEDFLEHLKKWLQYFDSEYILNMKAKSITLQSKAFFHIIANGHILLESETVGVNVKNNFRVGSQYNRAQNIELNSDAIDVVTSNFRVNGQDILQSFQDLASQISNLQEQINNLQSSAPSYGNP